MTSVGTGLEKTLPLKWSDCCITKTKAAADEINPAEKAGQLTLSKQFKMTTLPPLQIKTALRIAKPVTEVYEAIVDPGQMCNYFVQKSSGRMTAGQTVHWTFPEMDASFPVRVLHAEPGSRIAFIWSDLDGSETTVNITLTATADGFSFVEIVEGEKAASEEGIRWLKSNTEGWANFLACLKAWMEHGINLRKGAFDPSQMPA
jgi:uncharacterized protein YndB with AHSA1/START domain